MKKIKVFALLATLFVSVFSNMFTPVVSAEETAGSATVTIHKLKNITGPIVNTGSVLSGYTDADFLGGITYNVYDVTAAYHAKYNEVYTPTTAQAADDAAREYVQGTTAGHVPKFEGTSDVAYLVDTKTTATDETATELVPKGAATFTLPKKSGDKDAVYVFVEQPKTGITAAEKNLVLSFPVYELNSDGSYTDTELSVIHLYPKSTTEDITPVKEITTQNSDGAEPVEHNNYNVGEEIGFKLSTLIPANIGITEVDGVTPHYNTFGLIDTHDTTLTFNPAGEHELKVPKVADTDIVLEKITDYTIVVGEPTPDAGKATFKVKLTQAGINKLAKQGGQTLEFTYTMKLNATAKIDEANVNQVTVEYGRKTDTFDDVVTTTGNKKEVYTGGYRFIKTDVSTDKPLAGAEFVVRDAATEGQYLKIDDETKEISWVTSVTDATKFTTGSDGIVDIKGLTYGTYYLEETKAPEDYVKLSERIRFIVEFNSYTAHTTTTTEVKEHKVANTPKGFLPSTGGAGIILFVALGAAMVGLAGVYFTFRRKVA